MVDVTAVHSEAGGGHFGRAKSANGDTRIVWHMLQPTYSHGLIEGRCDSQCFLVQLAEAHMGLAG